MSDVDDSWALLLLHEFLLFDSPGEAEGDSSPVRRRFQPRSGRSDRVDGPSRACSGEQRSQRRAE